MGLTKNSTKCKYLIDHLSLYHQNSFGTELDFVKHDSCYDCVITLCNFFTCKKLYYTDN